MQSTTMQPRVVMITILNPRIVIQYFFQFFPTDSFFPPKSIKVVIFQAEIASEDNIVSDLQKVDGQLMSNGTGSTSLQDSALNK